MFLHAALRPPPQLLEAISLAVQAAEPPAVAPARPPQPRRGAFDRLAGRYLQVAESPIAPVSAFELIPVGRLSLPIAGFGSVAMRDAIRVAEGLKEEAEQWATPTVRIFGATVSEFPDRRSVALLLDGDVAELEMVARAVVRCVQRRGFRFDPHTFQPMLEVATIDRSATSNQVVSFLNGLEGMHGDPWTIAHISLLKRSFDTTSTDSMEYLRIPLGRR